MFPHSGVGLLKGLAALLAMVRSCILGTSMAHQKRGEKRIKAYYCGVENSSQHLPKSNTWNKPTVPQSCTTLSPSLASLIPSKLITFMWCLAGPTI